MQAKIHVHQMHNLARPIPFVKVKDRLDRLQQVGIVQFSDWAMPIVSVVKGDSWVRIYSDYRLTVNQISELDSYPLPNVVTCMSGGKSFSKLDLQHAYQQLVLDEELRQVTTHKGLATDYHLVSPRHQVHSRG